jgi:NAD-dependent SIR2 family protein deacetylase
MGHPGSSALADFIERAQTLTIVTGAGVSTASGIPDYRDRSGNWKHARPIQYADFVAHRSARQRYWARSLSGFARMADAKPNAAHRVIARFEDAGRIDTLITQNVDRLHSRAGSRRVIDLHGSLDQVYCLGCSFRASRYDWQRSLADANRNWKPTLREVRPDGDAELENKDYAQFTVPDCPNCAGIVKPDVIFFGEVVPKSRVEAAMAAVERADALLVVGSSLMVFSGFRFVRRARKLQKPVAILNRGQTRADDLAELKIDAECEPALVSAAAQLGV